MRTRLWYLFMSLLRRASDVLVVSPLFSYFVSIGKQMYKFNIIQPYWSIFFWMSSDKMGSIAQLSPSDFEPNEHKTAPWLKSFQRTIKFLQEQKANEKGFIRIWTREIERERMFFFIVIISVDGSCCWCCCLKVFRKNSEKHLKIKWTVGWRLTEQFRANTT